MKIYRVEHLERPESGLYNGEVPYPLSVFSMPVKHPVPEEDKKLCKGWDRLRIAYGRDVYFGFGSPEQMRQWVFDADWRDRLDKANYRLVTYEVSGDFAQVGDTQAVFVRSKATKIRVDRLV